STRPPVDAVWTVPVDVSGVAVALSLGAASLLVESPVGIVDVEGSVGVISDTIVSGEVETDELAATCAKTGLTIRKITAAKAAITTLIPIHRIRTAFMTTVYYPKGISFMNMGITKNGWAFLGGTYSLDGRLILSRNSFSNSARHWRQQSSLSYIPRIPK